jgi:preprotein translocase SecE subunit
MAMSVAEKVETAKRPANVRLQLALSSLIGGALVLVALWTVFAGLPLLWWDMVGIVNAFLSGALLLVASLVLITALLYGAYHLEKNVSMPGLRAGVFLAALGLYLATWLTVPIIGNFMATRQIENMIALIITALIGAGLLFLLFLLFTSAGFSGWLRRLEDHGWFHAIPYKPTQGMRVRRGTLFALLVVGTFGIFNLARGSLADAHVLLNDPMHYGVPHTWFWKLPFVAGAGNGPLFLPLMFKVNFLIPLLLFLALFWFAWRVTNWPTFADFLIATEAEMNKVSWTSRKRLIQDTIVVLTTVFLMTVFLFLVDILWIKVLSSPVIKVLQVDVRTEALKQQEKTQW